jgi:MFS family permease
MAAGLLTGGRMGDLYGRGRVLVAGIVGFTVASAACAVAGTPGELIAARAAQGLAGAVMLPQVFGLMRDLFAPEEMGKAFGVFGPAMGLSAMLGPIVAGGLIHLDVAGIGWRMIFLVNVPVGVAAAIIGARVLPARAVRPEGATLDLAGAAVAAVGMVMLVFPLVEGRALGWPAWLVAMLVVSLPVLGGFAVSQLRRKRAGVAPLVEPSLFGNRAYLAGVSFDLVFVGSMAGVVLIFNVLLQAGLGFTPWHSAITTVPWAAGAFVGSAIGGMTMAKFGRRVLHAGLVVETLGLLAIYVTLQAAGAGVGSLELLPSMMVGGLGMGMVFVPLFDIVMAGVEPHEMGSASGVLKTVDGLAMSLGVAGLGSVFFAIAGHGGAGAFLSAAEWVALATAGLLALAFVIAFRLPRHARQMPSQPDTSGDGARVAPLAPELAAA